MKFGLDLGSPPSACAERNCAEAAMISPDGAKMQPPGVREVWVLILIDASMFLLYFLAFTAARIDNTALFEQGRRQLDPILGFANTVILLTSSWFVVQSVLAARSLRSGRVKANLLLAMILGALFIALKVIGYLGDARQGHDIMTNAVFGFFGYYYMLTGIHLFHVIVGIIVLLVCYFKAKNKAVDENFLPWIESGACFWHMVDMLWVILFPMFYLLKAVP